MKDYQKLARNTIAYKTASIFVYGAFVLAIFAMLIGVAFVFPKSTVPSIGYYTWFVGFGLIVLLLIILFWANNKENKLAKPRFKTDQAKIDAMADYLRRMDEIKAEEQKFLAEIEAP